MESTPVFGEILDAAEGLSMDDQEVLIKVLRLRMIDRRRHELVQEVRQAHQEFKKGECRPITPSKLMKEIVP